MGGWGRQQAGKVVNLGWEFLLGVWAGRPAECAGVDRSFQRLPVQWPGGASEPFSGGDLGPKQSILPFRTALPSVDHGHAELKGAHRWCSPAEAAVSVICYVSSLG